MKVLFVCWYFPPANTIAAVRLGKLAKYLQKTGNEVRVLTARDLPYAATLPLEIPDEQVVRSDWWDINAIPGTIKRRLMAPFRGRPSDGSAARAPDRRLRQVERKEPRPPEKRESKYGGKLSAMYQRAVNIPDGQIGWVPLARRAGRRLLESWRPDVIFASGPPFSALLVGQGLSRTTGIPLVEELRDRWSDDPYYPPGPLRHRFESWLEGRVLGQASALTTVSGPWAEAYRAKYGKPVEVIYNGYDPADAPAEALEGWPDPKVLRILHTGGIYRGRRDPSPLFRAIARSDDLREKVRVVFYGLSTQYMPAMAREHGIEDCVEVYQRVDHDEALRQQYSSDILLLLQHDSPSEQGNVPGKFFEYLGARRPILVLGYREGVPGAIVKERAAGVVTTDPDEIAAQLRRWSAEKEALGRLPNLPPSVSAGFTHEEQALKLESFLREVVVGGQAG
ncbi:glycosyltransferase [Pelagibius marinus]|uniref:glycosyltransferase n=1 Tax=Pelagibius marinus TaxID=2762760 RepID=UPI0018732CB4|nr:glycosyltransferase [Pelagibius marinus]